MKRLVGFCLVLLMTTFLAVPAFADKAAEDKATMDTLMAMVDSGEITVEQALASAIEQGVSFTAIVAACQTRGIALSNVITAAATVGMTSEVALAKMADAGVSNEQMSAAMSQASGAGDTGLGYTPEQATVAITPVAPVTSNPGGTAQGGTVSPSRL